MVKYIVVVLMIGILLAGCDDFTSKPRFEGDVYTLAGHLVAGRAISLEHPIYITRSSTIEDFNLFGIYDLEAVVKVIDLTSQDTLSLVPRFDEFKIKWIDEDNNPIQSGHRYRIEVRITGYDPLIWAETLVPQSVSLVPDYYQYNVDGEGYSMDPDEDISVSYATVDERYPLALNTGNVSGAFNLMAEMYCLEEFSTALEFTVSVFGIQNPTADMESSYYASGESIRRIKFMGPYTSQSQPGQPDNFILVKDYKQAYVFFGRYRVSLYVIDDNYYRYSFMPEGYLQGGVHAALGYFGSASGGTMYTKLIR